ncbi:peroxidase family protein [Streptomyces albipurpureus]|uniref:Heme peroxidase n=1 Tax=Streptomyces albipurpureus TaxID=2897419 RepID=A0ABT0ULU7_9ACTN|nr:peroxidase family protein [Streptomyces sp. CWNU-1]MCM2389599.1 hypothetical protein [Streptomyces sp. CWNU-1]
MTKSTEEGSLVGQVRRSPGPTGEVPPARTAPSQTVVGQPGARVRTPGNDGWRNHAEQYFLSHGDALWKAAQAVPPLNRFLNRTIVNLAVTKLPARPRPLSTIAPYTSWPALVDRTYTGRHLPPVEDQESGRASVERTASLFTREPGRTKLCSRSTVLLPYFAQWFTDGFLRGESEEPRDPRRNTSTYDMDVNQLYGLNPDVLAQLRAFEGGRLKSQQINGGEFPPHLCRNGKIEPEFSRLTPVRFDTLSNEQKDGLFACGSDRANGQIGFTMMTVLFLREHNRIAGELAERQPRWDDERLFQTTRLILTAMLIKIAIEEYVNHIANFRFRFRMDPHGLGNPAWHRQAWISIEFNLMYRWHSLIPSTLQVGGQEMPMGQTIHRSPLLPEVGLGRLIADASEQRAGRLGLLNTDAGLGMLEAQSIAVGREVQLASYNDYRAYSQFPRITDFRQITADPAAQQLLSEVYRTPDDIDLFVGLMAEDPAPGAILGPLLQRMESTEAFSQMVVNPLLSPRVFHEGTFTAWGMRLIHTTGTLSDVVHRNIPEESEQFFIGMAARQTAR